MGEPMEKNADYVAHLERIIRGADLLVWNIGKDLKQYIEHDDKEALDRALTNATGEQEYLRDQIERLGIGDGPSEDHD